MSERDIKKLLAAIERALGKEWLDIADWLREQNGLDKIEERLSAGDIEGMLAEVRAAALRFAAETHNAYTLAGRRESLWLDTQIDDKLVRFDVTNQRAVARAQQNQLELVSGLTNETRETIRNVIVDGTRAGLNPRSIARGIRDSIGLNPAQERAVRSYREALSTGQYANALGRELADGRGDRTVRRAQRDREPLTEAQIDSLVERYRANQLAYRAEVIARTESLRNVHAGLDDAFRQAIERGDVEPGALVREWIAGPSTANARGQHQTMDGQKQPFGEPFVAPDGTRLMFPGDGPVDHSANCRCTVATTLAA